MSYYSEKRMRFFSEPAIEAILDRLDRIEVALAEMGKFVNLQGLGHAPQQELAGGAAAQQVRDE